MSFVDNLYNCFTVIQKNAALSRRSVEDLIRFFRVKIEIEEDHMKGLERLANFSLKIREGTILNAVNALKNDCYSRGFQIKSLIDNINADIISPLSLLLKTHSETIKPSLAEGLKIKKIKENYVESLQNSKKKY